MIYKNLLCAFSLSILSSLAFATGTNTTKTSPTKKEIAKPAKKEKAEKAEKAEDTKRTDCEITLDSTDTMQFEINKKRVESITVSKSCETFIVKLKHIGKFKSSIMGHNFVLTKETDKASLVQELLKLGPAKNYLPTEDMDKEPFKSKVLAASTKLLGGDPKDVKSENIEIKTGRLEVGGKYIFFCSFPGHATSMQGKLIVTEKKNAS